jgi:hypothetical protein
LPFESVFVVPTTTPELFSNSRSTSLVSGAPPIALTVPEIMALLLVGEAVGNFVGERVGGSVSAGGEVKIGSEQNLMYVTAPLPVIITLIHLTLSVSIFTTWKELSPKIGTSIIFSIKAPSLFS